MCNIFARKPIKMFRSICCIYSPNIRIYTLRACVHELEDFSPYFDLHQSGSCKGSIWGTFVLIFILLCPLCACMRMCEFIYICACVFRGFIWGRVWGFRRFYDQLNCDL